MNRYHHHHHQHPSNNHSLLMKTVVGISMLMLINAFTIPTVRRSGVGSTSGSKRIVFSPFVSSSIQLNTLNDRSNVGQPGGLQNVFSSTSSSAETRSEAVKWSMDKVRSEFIKYFSEKHSHTFYPSSPCIPPPSDTTLLFTNAGMNQYKPIFLNQIPPNTPLAGLKRATNSQKCIRAGGKHNDLDDVGKDTYHHTFFEMLGSWSFGDYFKEEAVDMAWDLLVNVYGLDKERLYVTYFEGNESVPKDTEVIEFWKKYVPEERIIGCDAKDNFWEMGETGPCGPCTEIHYDRIGGRDASALVNADSPDVIEIWNVVFIQYNREDESTLKPLPLKHIDTGMGLERLTSILQNKGSNYDIDAFRVLIDKLETISGVDKYEGRILEKDVDLKDTAYRAVVDHIRTLSFAVADGAMPNNEGRGYVLRRILRRAARYGYQILQCKPGFLEELLPVMMTAYGTFYPELLHSEDKIRQVLREEESSFSSLLDRGIKFFTALEHELKSNGENAISGDKAFFMYDTLGFPIDLTTLMAEEAGLTVDTNAFIAAMEGQKQRSRDARTASNNFYGGVMLTLGTEDVAVLERLHVPPSNDDHKYDWDVTIPSSIQAMYTNAHGKVDTISLQDMDVGDSIGLVLDQTSFYAEAGGQDCDTGTLSILHPSTKERIDLLQIHQVQSYGDYILHVGTILPSSIDSSLSISAAIQCKVDYKRRRKIAPNHTMTHVLNAALRTILQSDDIEQRGSLVSHDKLRFDFSFNKALTTKQLSGIENYVNDIIDKNMEVRGETVPLSDAKKIPGVCAVFGEVYPDPVRVLRVLRDDDTVESVEFCGGTHLQNTNQAELFIIVEETAVAKGVRRITALTRDLAKEARNMGIEMEAIITKTEEEAQHTISAEQLESKAISLRKQLESRTISATLKPKLRTRIESLQKKSMDLKKVLMAQAIDAYVESLKDQLEDHDMNLPFVFMLQDDDNTIDSKSIPKIMNSLKGIQPTLPFLGVMLLSEQNKVLCFTNVPKEKQKLISAKDWLNIVLNELGGKGGGKDGNAQGQAVIEGKDVDLTNVLNVAKVYALEKIGLTVE